MTIDENGKWYHSVRNGEKTTIQGDILIFKENGKAFAWQGDLLQQMNVFKINELSSAQAKNLYVFLREMIFDQQK